MGSGGFSGLSAVHFICLDKRVRRVFFALFDAVHRLLQSPVKVLWICLALAFVNLILDGSLYRYYVLTKDLKQIRGKIEQVSLSNENLEEQIRKMKDPSHLEQVARERFDLVKENELVFVFSEDQSNQQQEVAFE